MAFCCSLLQVVKIMQQLVNLILVFWNLGASLRCSLLGFLCMLDRDW